MILKELSDREVKVILGKRKILIEGLYTRMGEMYAELDFSDDIVREVSLQAQTIGHIGSGGGGRKKDLADVMIRHEKVAKNRSREIRIGMWNIIEEIETIERVWTCYQSLKAEAYQIISDLYVSRMPYKEVEEQSQMSHKKFERIRGQAIKDILRLYHSHKHNIEILMIGTRDKNLSTQKQSRNRAPYEQIKMDLK